jgi:hypothetical protein
MRFVDQSCGVPVMPNPYRKLAKGQELYVIWVPLWVDDVSANVSKSYNKHVNIYMANANLPGQLLQQEYFVHFVASSPHASCGEQLTAVLDKIRYVT